MKTALSCQLRAKISKRNSLRQATLGFGKNNQPQASPPPDPHPPKYVFLKSCRDLYNACVCPMSVSRTATLERRQGCATAGAVSPVQPELGSVLQAAPFQCGGREALRLCRLEPPRVSGSAHSGKKGDKHLILLWPSN